MFIFITKIYFNEKLIIVLINENIGGMLVLPTNLTKADKTCSKLLNVKNIAYILKYISESFKIYSFSPKEIVRGFAKVKQINDKNNEITKTVIQVFVYKASAFP